jgi:DNA-directed RNA polymerase specialized sigma24 family protein
MAPLFPSSHWSLIVRTQGEGREARVALDQLLRRYETTIVALIRKRPIPPDVTVEDIKQELVTGIWSRKDFKHLLREKGRFRSWLSTAVAHQVYNTWDAYHAKKNGRWIVTTS